MSVDSALCVANFTKKGVRPNQLAVSWLVHTLVPLLSYAWNRNKVGHPFDLVFVVGKSRGIWATCCHVCCLVFNTITDNVLCEQNDNSPRLFPHKTCADMWMSVKMWKWAQKVHFIPSVQKLLLCVKQVNNVLFVCERELCRNTTSLSTFQLHRKGTSMMLEKKMWTQKLQSVRWPDNVHADDGSDETFCQVHLSKDHIVSCD